jgi:hypothetical protein
MQRSTVITAILAAGVAIALMTSIGTYTTLAESQSNIKRQNDEEMKSMINEMKEMKSMMSRMSEKMDMMMDRMDTMLNGMDMLMAMLMGDMMGPMDDMVNQEPLDVIIKIKSSPKVQVGKEAEVMLLVLDKRTQEPMEGVQVLIGIERGSSMTSMEMMGDMFEAEDKGSGQYVVRFTPDNEGVYTIHTMVMLPGRSMMDNHMDFGIIAQTSDI